MDDRTYKILRNVAVVLTAAFLGWWAYDSLVVEREPGENAYHAANKYFEDGYYERALGSYRESLAADPDNIHALRGIARSLMQLGRNDEALAAFNKAVEWRPGVGATYANRGILYDRTGKYRKAMADYEKALELDPELAEGPHWLDRFLHNEPDKPPTIAERLAYLREQMALPKSQRVLRVRQIDEQQRPYKM